MNLDPIDGYPTTRFVWRAIVIYLIVVSLCFVGFIAQAVAQEVEQPIIESPTTFAICKAADIATTAYILGNGGVELNPIVAWTLKAGYAPLIVVSLGIWLAMKHYGTPAGNTVINVATCGVAIHNLVQIP
jgi:hypothetical protein